MTRSDGKPYDSAAALRAFTERARDAAEGVTHVPTWWRAEARRFHDGADPDAWAQALWPARYPN